MRRVFNIVRDLSKYAYAKGSDRIALTQFDSGDILNLILLHQQEPFDPIGCRVLVSFVNQEGKLLVSEECAVIQDLSLDPRFNFQYLMDERLTLEAGELNVIIDLIDEDGYRTALNPFKITILPHLLKEPVVLNNDELTEEIEQPDTPE